MDTNINKELYGNEKHTFVSVPLFKVSCSVSGVFDMAAYTCNKATVKPLSIKEVLITK